MSYKPINVEIINSDVTQDSWTNNSTNDDWLVTTQYNNMIYRPEQVTRSIKVYIKHEDGTENYICDASQLNISHDNYGETKISIDTQTILAIKNYHIYPEVEEVDF